jgi:small nuclear ribonucleoprotein (snRNP)-like protein
VDDTLDELKDTNFSTHLDLASGLWQVRVREEELHKTTFQTPHSLMEWVAIPFGMCNATTTYQHMMNDTQRDFLHKLVTVYLNDVRVYIRTLEEHLEHLRLVLQCLKEDDLKLRRFFGLQKSTWVALRQMVKF